MFRLLRPLRRRQRPQFKCCQQQRQQQLLLLLLLLLLGLQLDKRLLVRKPNYIGYNLYGIRTELNSINSSLLMLVPLGSQTRISESEVGGV